MTRLNRFISMICLSLILALYQHLRFTSIRSNGTFYSNHLYFIEITSFFMIFLVLDELRQLININYNYSGIDNYIKYLMIISFLKNIGTIILSFFSLNTLSVLIIIVIIMGIIKIIIGVKLTRNIKNLRFFFLGLFMVFSAFILELDLFLYLIIGYIFYKSYKELSKQ